MKKLISLIIALVCMLSLFACGGNDASAIKEFELKGEKMERIELKNYVLDRQQEYLKKDMEKTGAGEDKWFDIDIKNQWLGESADSSYEIFWHINGRMGVLIGSEDIALDVEVYIDGVQFDTENGKESKETVNVEGNIIYVDGVAYADLEVKQMTAGMTTTITVKQKSELDEALSFVELDIERFFYDYFVWNDTQTRIYGINVAKLVNNLRGEHYLDKNTIYLERRTSTPGTYADVEETLQYKIEFEKNSAIVKSALVYGRTLTQNKGAFSEYTSTQDIKTLFSIESIGAQKIKVPDADDYKWAD